MKRACLLLLVFLLLLPQAALAQTETYVFPNGGLRVQADAAWQPLTPEHLPDTQLAALGLSADALRATYAAEGTVADFYLPEGGQIVVNVVVDDASQALRSITRMTAEEKQALRDTFAAMTLYQGVEWADEEHLRMQWTLESAGLPVSALSFVTVRQGAFYRYTAWVPGKTMPQTLEDTLAAFVAQVEYLGAIATPSPTTAPTPTPSPSPTPAPTPGVAPVIDSKNKEAQLAIEGLPAYSDHTTLSITGVAEPSAMVRLIIDDKEDMRLQANGRGLFQMDFVLPAKDGMHELRWEATARDLEVSRTYQVELRQRMVPIEILSPHGTVTEPTFLLQIRTLPGAAVLVKTPNDTLRARADAQGLVDYTISVRREGDYAYELSASLDGYVSGAHTLVVPRRLNEAEANSAFRREITTVPYARLAGEPKDQAGKKIELRGRIAAIQEVEGYPCLLIHTANPGTGVWRDPVWVLCDQILEMAVGDVVSVLGEVRGDAYPYGELSVPVVQGRYFMK